MIPYAEVIGDPIAHSKSPLLHRFWLERLGIAGDYRAVRVAPDDLPAYVERARADPDWRGCNVTMPHKLSIGGLIDDRDTLAIEVGAVNTVFRDDGGLRGTNTDVAGIAEPLDRSDRKIGAYANHVATYAQIIGAGGAARAAVSAMKSRADVEFYARRVEQAKALAEACGLPEWFGMGLDEIGPIKNADETGDEQRYSHIVINASPMGMAGKSPVPIDLTTYPKDTIVFDMVYAPLDTPLLKAARAAGLRTIDGLEMLIGQAALAFELFFGTAPPREQDVELRALLTA